MLTLPAIVSETAMKRGARLKHIVPIIIGIVVIAEVFYLWHDRHRADGEQVSLSDRDYAGSEGCRSCHGRQYSDWKESHHDLAMMEADARSVKGSFDTTFVSQGVTSRFFQRDGRYFVNTEGPDGAYHDYEVTHTFGVEPLQQYLMKFPDGRLQVLRTAWDTRENKWFDLYPDYEIASDEWLHWSRGGLNWNTMCADCHSTNVHKNFLEDEGSFNTTFTLMNVSCEACHGPAKKHVEIVSALDFDSTGYDPRVHLYLTSGLSSRDQVDQCARCHSRRAQVTEAYNHEGEFMDHYIPAVLSDDIYHADGQIRDEVYEYGSFLQSKMYRNNVKCSDCHNPHSLKLKGVGNGLCGQCHDPLKYDTRKHHFHAEETEGASCVNCHMPGRVYMGNDFRRDHSLRVPRPDLSVQYNTPNACNQCHTGESAEWAAAAVEEWYGPERKPHFSEVLTFASTRSVEAVAPLVTLAGDTSQPAIARATAVWYLGQMISPEATQAIIRSLENEDHLVRHTAVNALGEMPEAVRIRHLAPLLNDKIRTVRYAAASGLADISADGISNELRSGFENVMREYEMSFSTRADFAGGQIERAIFYQRRGQPELAEQAYLKAIDIDNRQNAARLNLAHLYNSQGRNSDAIALFRAVIKQEPEFGTAWYSLGLLYAEENAMNAAIVCLSRAAELEDNPRVFYNLAVAYQRTGQAQKAEDAYLRGLRKDAVNQDLIYALSVLYIQQEEIGKARPWVQKLNELNPENPRVREMIRIVSGGMAR